MLNQNIYITLFTNSMFIVDCGSAPEIGHAAKNTSMTTYNTYVYYACNNGYNESGSPDYVYCQANKTWTNTSYACIPNGMIIINLNYLKKKPPKPRDIKLFNT